MAVEFRPSHLDSYIVIVQPFDIALGGLIKEYTVLEPNTYYFTPSGLVMETEEVLAIYNKLKELNRA